MRKNRANNGYVGSFDYLNNKTGTLHSSKLNQIDQSVLNGELNYPSYYETYEPPTNGGGYGVTASAVIGDGSLISVQVLEGGTGYRSNTIAIISGGSGPTVYGNITLSGSAITNINPWYVVKSAIINDGGQRYTSTPIVSFSAPTNGAGICTGSISGNTFTITTLSSGVFYPGQILSGTGVTSNTLITNYGTGTGSVGTYTVSQSQTVGSRTITGSGTATATATVLNGVVSSINMTYSGARYTAGSPPTVTISGGSPVVDANAYAEISSATGYNSRPDITFLASGTGAGFSGFAEIMYSLKNIQIVNGGTGYTTSPTVWIEGAYGSGLTATANISGGSVSGISFSSNSALFPDVPKIEVNGWTPLPSVNVGEQKVVGNFAVYDNDSNFVAFSVVGGTFNVDWGDGTTGSFASNTQARKQYTKSIYDSLTTKTPYRGYKDVVISITAPAGVTWTTVNLGSPHPNLFTGSEQSSNWLNIKMSAPNLTSLLLNNSAVVHALLEQFDYIGTNNITSFSGTFRNCYSLEKVVNLHTNAGTSFNNMFFNCFSLKFIPNINTSRGTNFASMFYYCNSLETIPYINTGLGTAFNSMFSNCHMLKKIPFLDTRNGLDCSFMFYACWSLQEIPHLNTSKNTNFSSMFAGASQFSPGLGPPGALRSIPQLDTSAGTDFSNMFVSQEYLQTIPQLDLSKGTNFSYMFLRCTSLKFLPRLNTINGTNFHSMFSLCSSLEYIPYLDTRNGSTLTSLFRNCLKLKYLPQGLNTANATDMQNFLSGTLGLKEIPKLNTSLVTNITNFFWDSNQSVPALIKTLPLLDFGRCLNFSSAFTNCYVLQNVPDIVVKPGRAAGALATTGYNTMFYFNYSLAQIPELDFSGATGSSYTSIMNSFMTSNLATQRIKVRALAVNLTLPNPNKMSPTELNELFTNLATVGASGAGARTLTITNSWGATGCNRGIATVKGWTITG
jgi:hypothetical protein